MTDADRYRARVPRLARLRRARQARAGRRAARAAADGLAGRVAAAGCAGHVLDYDDTYAAGLVHASAPVAPVALLLAAELRPATRGGAGRVCGRLRGHRGACPREPSGAVRARLAPDVGVRSRRGGRGRGAPARLSTRSGSAPPSRSRCCARAGCRQRSERTARRCRSGSPRPPGCEAARLAAAGAGVPPDAVATGFEAAYGATWAAPRGRPAIRENWIKAYPCCLMTHSRDRRGAGAAGAGTARRRGEIVVAVHPTARRAAPATTPADGLAGEVLDPVHDRVHAAARPAGRRELRRRRMRRRGPSRPRGSACAPTRPCSRSRRGSRSAGRS